jgi:hypothetical protein
VFREVQGAGDNLLLGVYQLSERWGAISEGGKMSEVKKSVSPIGETVLTVEQIKEAFRTWPDDKPKAPTFNYWLCQAQDVHTRKEVAKVIKERLGDDGMLFIREPQLQDWFEAFIKELEGK